jgi:transcriptional regulator with XRE-family HTH domain
MVKQPVSVNGVIRWRDVGLAEDARREPKERKMVVLRHEIGDVLRDVRQRQGRTLREVSHSARVSLGYLSEVERGQKEASSELLSSICTALDVPLSLMLREVSDRVASAEGIAIPDTVPSEFSREFAREFPEDMARDLARRPTSVMPPLQGWLAPRTMKKTPPHGGVFFLVFGVQIRGSKRCFGCSWSRYLHGGYFDGA